MRCQKCGFTNSPTAKFCKRCGMSLPRANAAPAVTATAPAAAAPEPVVAAPGNASVASVVGAAAGIGARDATQCPQCATPRVPGKRFCRQCRFDFTPLDGAAPVAALPEVEVAAQAAPAEEPAAIAVTLPASQAAQIEPTAVESCPVVADVPTSAREDASAFAPVSESATSNAETAPEAAIETCPLCSTSRVPGKRFCRGCRFDYTSLAEGGLNGVTTGPAVEEPTIHTTTTPADGALQVPTAETPAHAEPDTPTGKAAQPLPIPGALPRDKGQPEPATDRPTGTTLGDNAGLEPTIKSGEARGAQPPVQNDPPARSGSSKALLIGGAAVIVVGIAVGAGLFIRSQHAKAPDAQTAASTPIAASAPPVVEAASATPATPAIVAASDAASGAAPASAAANVQAGPANEANAASSTADVAASDAPPTPAPATAATAQPQPQPAPPEQAQMPASPAPETTSDTQNVVAEPTPSAPSVHPKPHKTVTPAADNTPENATIRAAIEGSLADGGGCFSNKKFDCAISNADAVLRLDPRNAQALALRRRAKAAQDAALNSLSIQ